MEGLYLDSSGVQGDFDVVRISSVWCMTAKSTGKCTMQVNMFLDLEQRNLQQQEHNHLNLSLCCKNVYLPEMNEVVVGVAP